MTETMFEPEEENEQYIRYYAVSNGMRDTACVVFARFAEHKDALDFVKQDAFKELLDLKTGLRPIGTQFERYIHEGGVLTFKSSIDCAKLLKQHLIFQARKKLTIAEQRALGI